MWRVAEEEGCIQEARWRGMGLKFLGSLGRRFKLWGSDNEDEIAGIGILVKENLSMNVVEINRMSEGNGSGNYFW